MVFIKKDDMYVYPGISFWKDDNQQTSVSTFPVWATYFSHSTSQLYRPFIDTAA